MNGALEDEVTRNAIRGAVRYAEMFLESGDSDPGLIEDARGVLERYGRMDKVLATWR